MNKQHSHHLQHSHRSKKRTSSKQAAHAFGQPQATNGQQPVSGQGQAQHRTLQQYYHDAAHQNKGGQVVDPHQQQNIMLQRQPLALKVNDSCSHTWSTQHSITIHTFRTDRVNSIMRLPRQLASRSKAPGRTLRSSQKYVTNKQVRERSTPRIHRRLNLVLTTSRGKSGHLLLLLFQLQLFSVPVDRCALRLPRPASLMLEGGTASKRLRKAKLSYAALMKR